MKRLCWGLLLLVGCKSAGIAPRVASVTDSLGPDQIMQGMKFYLIRNGVRTGVVEADTAKINQQTRKADLLGLKITFSDTATGRSMSVVTSKTGLWDMQNESLDARGNVVAVTTTMKTLRTEHLVYDKVQDRITSDTAFTVTGATENMSGAAFEADPGFKNVVVRHPTGREVLPSRSNRRPAAKKDGGA